MADRSVFRSLFGAGVGALMSLAAGTMISTAAWAEARLALVVGQSNYRAVTPLPNPANDAAAMTKMLADAGFEVMSASNLSQAELRQQVSAFAGKVAEKGPDTVALMFYAGHGIQVDGENYLIPVDVDPKRETDVTLQAVRLNDVLNTLTSVPSKTRIILLDACRNNPFPGVNATVGRGLAQVDVKFGAPGTLLSYSTSPGAEAEDGTGGNSPYTTALLEAGRQPGVAIEDAFKRVRLAVNKATEGRQTPWESSSLVSDFRFFGGSSDAATPVKAVARKSVDEWKREIRSRSITQANDEIVADGSVEAYEAFVSLFTAPPFGPQAREWLDRHYRLAAWHTAVLTNTAAGYRAFLAQFPDSDLTITARRLEERTRDRPAVASALALAAPTCPCAQPTNLNKPEPAKKRAETKPKPRPTTKRPVYVEEEEVIVRRPPVYAPSPVVIGVGTIIGGGGYGRPPRGGGYDRPPSRVEQPRGDSSRPAGSRRGF